MFEGLALFVCKQVDINLIHVLVPICWTTPTSRSVCDSLCVFPQAGVCVCQFGGGQDIALLGV